MHVRALNSFSRELRIELPAAAAVAAVACDRICL